MPRLVRIECEQRARTGGALTDQRTGAPAFFHRGEDTVFELALFQNRRMLSRAEVSTLSVKWFNSAHELIQTHHFENSNMSSSLTAAQWRTGGAALARLLVNGADTSALPAGFFTMEVWANQGGLDSIFASGLIEGVTIPTLVQAVFDPPNPPQYWNKDEADARYDFKDEGAAALALAEQVSAFTGHIPGGTDPGKFLLFEAQTLADDEKLIARKNIGAAPGGGARTIPGESSGPGNANAIPDGYAAAVTTVTPAGNTVIELRAPVLAAGVRHLLRVQQGFGARWTADYTFPPNAITVGPSSGGFARETWHPATGEGYDVFELLNDGTTTRVSRLREIPPPPAITDWMPESPLVTHAAGVFTSLKDRSGLSMAAVAGTPSLGTMAGSPFPALVYDGVDDAHAWNCEPFAAAAGMAVAMVFTATASTGQKCLFHSTALGIQIVADTDGLRLQARDAASGTGLLISASYSAKPVAFVAVIRPGGAGAYALTTDPSGGGETGSFTPAAGMTPGHAHLASTASTSRYLACKVGRCQVFRSGLNPDQARAVLDALTQYYQLG